MGKCWHPGCAIGLSFTDIILALESYENKTRTTSVFRLSPVQFFSGISGNRRPRLVAGPLIF